MTRIDPGACGKGEAGFTLLELLIAMTLLGFLTVLFFGGLKFGVLAWERGEAHSAGTDEVRAVQQLLRRELSEAYPFYVTEGGLHPHVMFDGGARSLTFLAPAPRSLAAAGKARVTLQAVPAGKGMKLVIEARPELAFADDPSASIRDVLIDDLKDVAFAYFGAERAGDPPLWHDRWAGEPMLPKLVRVQVTFPAEDARKWPSLVVAPQIDVDVACGYDALTKSCRGR